VPGHDHVLKTAARFGWRVFKLASYMIRNEAKVSHADFSREAARIRVSGPLMPTLCSPDAAQRVALREAVRCRAGAVQNAVFGTVPVLRSGMSAMLRIAKMPHRARDTVSHLVIAGLDPAIHPFRKTLCEDGWIRGSSPRMTQIMLQRLAKNFWIHISNSHESSFPRRGAS
jgi:hypothetical protein